MIRRWQAFVIRHTGLGPYLAAPGDGRVAPVVPVRAVLWALLAAYVVRDGAFHAVEALGRSCARRALGIRRAFGDDTVAYVTERLDVGTTPNAARALTRSPTSASSSMGPPWGAARRCGARGVIP